MPPRLSALLLADQEALRSSSSRLHVHTALRCVLENAIDAQASSLTVRLQPGSGGGFAVEDDGCGISPASIQLLGTRYSTSKPACQGSSSQLGYRGEALASICNQARLHVVSRAADSFECWEVQLGPASVQHSRGLCNPSSSLRHTEGGPGTRVEVTSFGDAAQLGRQTNQHLRATGEVQAATACKDEVLRTMLPFTHIGVRVLDGAGQLVLSMPKGRSLPAWASNVLHLGQQQPDPSRWFEEEAEQMQYRVQGLILGPQHARVAPDLQLAYVNGRRVLLPSELQANVESIYRDVYLRSQRELSYQQQQRSTEARSSSGGRGSGSKAGNQRSGGSVSAASGSARLGVLGPVFAPYVLLIVCPHEDVLLDASRTESGTAAVTLKQQPLVSHMLVRLTHRALGAQVAVAAAALTAPQSETAADCPTHPSSITILLSPPAAQPKQSTKPLPAPLLPDPSAHSLTERPTKSVCVQKPSLLHPNSRSRSIVSLNAVHTEKGLSGSSDQPQVSEHATQLYHQQQTEQQQQQNSRVPQSDNQAEIRSFYPVHIMPCLSGMLPWLKATKSNKEGNSSACHTQGNGVASSQPSLQHTSAAKPASDSDCPSPLPQKSALAVGDSPSPLQNRSAGLVADSPSPLRRSAAKPLSDSPSPLKSALAAADSPSPLQHKTAMPLCASSSLSPMHRSVADAADSPSPQRLELAIADSPSPLPHRSVLANTAGSPSPLQHRSGCNAIAADSPSPLPHRPAIADSPSPLRRSAAKPLSDSPSPLRRSGCHTGAADSPSPLPRKPAIAGSPSPLQYRSGLAKAADSPSPLTHRSAAIALLADSPSPLQHRSAMPLPTSPTPSPLHKPAPVAIVADSPSPLLRRSGCNAGAADSPSPLQNRSVLASVADSPSPLPHKSAAAIEADSPSPLRRSAAKPLSDSPSPLRRSGCHTGAADGPSPLPRKPAIADSPSPLLRRSGLAIAADSPSPLPHRSHEPSFHKPSASAHLHALRSPSPKHEDQQQALPTSQAAPTERQASPSFSPPSPKQYSAPAPSSLSNLTQQSAVHTAIAQSAQPPRPSISTPPCLSHTSTPSHTPSPLATHAHNVPQPPAHSSKSLVHSLLEGWRNPMQQQRDFLDSHAVLSLEQIAALPHPASHAQTTYAHTSSASAASMPPPHSTNAGDLFTHSSSSYRGRPNISATPVIGSLKHANYKDPSVKQLSSKHPQQQLKPESVTRAELQAGIRVLGQVDHQYMMCISANGLLLCVDQHAAHERIRLEHLAARLRDEIAGTVNIKGMLQPPHPTTHSKSMPLSPHSAAHTPQKTPSSMSPALQPPHDGVGGVNCDDANGGVGGVNCATNGGVGGVNCATNGGVSQSRLPRIGGPSTGLLAAVQKRRQGRLAAPVLTNQASQMNMESAEPVPLVFHRLDRGAAAGRGVHMELSSREWCAWVAHGVQVRQWGWELVQLGGRDAASADEMQLQQPSQQQHPLQQQQHPLQQQQQLVSGCGAVGAQVSLVQVPVIYGVELGAPDLLIYLHQLEDCRNGVATATASPQLFPPGVLRVLRSRSCRSALMFGDPLQHRECEELLGLLEQCQLWHSCAHGRPTVAPITHLPSFVAALECHQQTSTQTTKPSLPFSGTGIAQAKHKQQCTALTLHAMRCKVKQAGSY